LATSYHLSTADIPSRDYGIPTLPASRPFRWLRLGWTDLRSAPVTSLAYGLLLALAGLLLTSLLLRLDRFFLVPIFTAGFFILAPLLAGPRRSGKQTLCAQEHGPAICAVDC
jgi:uncharacterized membrane protein